MVILPKFKSSLDHHVICSTPGLEYCSALLKFFPFFVQDIRKYAIFVDIKTTFFIHKSLNLKLLKRMYKPIQTDRK